MMLLGAHVSTAGGTAKAPARAKFLGATAMQIFSKMANRWAERACEDDECREFRTALADTDVAVTSAHDSYLINLASPDVVLRARSLESFISELHRCEALGLDYLVSHPGNYIDDRASGLDRNSEALGIALEMVPGRTRVLLESTAGSGTVLGANFEELALLIDHLPKKLQPRVGVCIDSQHIFASGYDIVNDYDGVWRHFGDVVGFDRLGMMHLNDSKVPFGCRRDRHQLIGLGAIGEEPFHRIMTDERLARVAKVIETPKLDNDQITDSCMLILLRHLASHPRH